MNDREADLTLGCCLVQVFEGGEGGKEKRAGGAEEREAWGQDLGDLSVPVLPAGSPTSHVAPWCISSCLTCFFNTYLLEPGRSYNIRHLTPGSIFQLGLLKAAAVGIIMVAPLPPCPKRPEHTCGNTFWLLGHGLGYLWKESASPVRGNSCKTPALQSHVTQQTLMGS